MKPDAARHNPAPARLRALLERAGLSQVQAARQVGITPRAMRYYLAETGPRAPYPVQFALECLAGRSAPARRAAKRAGR